MRVAVVPAVESLFLAGSVVELAAGARVEAVLVTPVEPVAPVREVVAVLEAVVPVAAVGFLAAAVVPVVPVALVVVGFEGLDIKVLVRRAVVPTLDFFSSSLALTLGLLRWLAVELVAVVGRVRVVDVVVGGLVGGLLKPPVAVRAEPAVPVAPVLDAGVVVVVPGLRTVPVVVPAGRRTVVVVVVLGLASPLALFAADVVVASGELGAGVSSLSVASIASLGTSDADSMAASAGASEGSSE